MANTPQSKKRIRRNAARETINHSRVSRIRTFIKAVELAISRARRRTPPRLSKRPSLSCSVSCPRSYPQEHGLPEDFASVEKGCDPRLNRRLKKPS